MLLLTYYARNDAGIIGTSLTITVTPAIEFVQIYLHFWTHNEYIGLFTRSTCV